MKNPNYTACNAVALRSGIFTTLLLALGFSALWPTPNAFGVVPAPDGGYPGFNTAEGTNALKNLTTGVANTAAGWFSLSSNTDGAFNTAVGAGTLVLNVGDQSTGDGVNNTAVGAAALLLNTTGTNNTAVGVAALVNSDGDSNTGVGAFALNKNTTGVGNTANGVQALFSNTEGHDNTAVGYQALFSNVGTIGGAGNTAIGSKALYHNISGGTNTAIGLNALFFNTNSDNTAIGLNALLENTGFNNIALGAQAGTFLTTGNNNIHIGNLGAAAQSDTIRVGNAQTSTFIAGIYSNVQPAVGIDPDFVTINSSGRLGRSNISSRRYKHDIKPMDNASETILALKPVSFRYYKAYDATQTLAFGLIAEDVAEVDPDLVGRNAEGQPESVRYEQINAMLLNEFLKEHRKVEEQGRKIQEQETTITHLKKEMKTVVARLKDQDSNVQRVSAQIELIKSVTTVAKVSQ